ncbi:SDR family NAD(P)-dependent oxidoreductase [Natrinema thermotolerans]|uniref:SDR family NAD(P)-dependent oxidoreductase n=1 Tax=Natrinema thermotolerans TaxID=121872 RepID=A0AAF0T4T0_9EURY|nr:SDR family NAD(P)-dependent oxidoreductase [Natrinema thermotolerans]QCC59596.1 SDR family NAD(P)-dependent oxidoreductase [Natrinema thermotolerans]WMT06574.1 SDR family NAD(P)-dependent oxidoreductase [Natrinema thermotolerans]
MTRTAVIAGVGPGLGASLARKFVDEGCRVGLFARSDDSLEALATELGDDALAVPTDITDPEAVAAGFDAVREAFGPVDVLINHASGGSWKGLREISPDEFERAWRVSVHGALLCSQAAVDDMLAGDGGTIVFTGATSAVRGRDGAIGFSAAKFAVRGMAESMARELGPEGIHVAHVVIDGGIRPPEMDDAAEASGYLDPDAIADSYWHLVTQDRSAWTLELDLRPHVEAF